MTRYLAPALAALLLAGCNAANDTAATNAAAVEPRNDAAEANDAGNTGAGNATSAVLALNDRQRNAVFIRAILDAGLQCEGVTASERIADQNGQPTWRANCGANSAHIISIGPDGTATINSRAN